MSGAPASNAPPSPRSTGLILSLIVVQNWHEELKRLVPARAYLGARTNRVLIPSTLCKMKFTRKQIAEDLKAHGTVKVPGQDLSELDLSGLKFGASTLNGANLTGANLAEANLNPLYS